MEGVLLEVLDAFDSVSNGSMSPLKSRGSSVRSAAFLWQFLLRCPVPSHPKQISSRETTCSLLRFHRSTAPSFFVDRARLHLSAFPICFLFSSRRVQYLGSFNFDVRSTLGKVFRDAPQSLGIAWRTFSQLDCRRYLYPSF